MNSRSKTAMHALFGAAVLLVSAAACGQRAPEPQATLSAASRGNAEAQYRLGRMYDLGEGVQKDYREAVGWYRRAAEQNHAPAQFALAEMYKNGDGVAKDINEAVKWYRRAADNGSAGAQLLLGVLYESGVGVKQDFADAARWYRRSAEQKDARAQMMLANLYPMGQGVPRNRVAAYALYTVSAGSEPKDNPSLGHRTQMTRLMTAAEVEAGQRLAVEISKAGAVGGSLDRLLPR